MAKSYIGVIRKFEAREKVHGYSLRALWSWCKDMSGKCLLGMCLRAWREPRMTIYCGVVKLHWCDASLTWKLVSEDHLSRRRFLELSEIVFGRKEPRNLVEMLERGEQVRDRVLHGLEWNAAEARSGLTDMIDFAAEFDAFVEKHAGFRPLGDLRGFKGRKESLTPASTRWILRGMGIPKKDE